MFAPALRELRRKAGFSTARSFFKAKGGQRAFGCTYKAYLNVEAGRSVPKPELALRLAAALGAHQDPRRGRAFAEGYLRSRLGNGELAELALSALAARPRTDPGAFMERASRRSYTLRPRVPISRAQAELLCSTPAHYWSFSLLLGSREPWTAAELARRAGLPPAKTEAAMAELAERGLLLRKGPGYACPLVGKLVTWPRRSFYLPDHRAAMRAHWEAMAAKRGKALFERRAALRCSEASLRRGYPALQTAVYGANVLALRTGGPDTGLYLIEAVARRP